MNETYIKYGAIALGVVVILYLMSRSSGASSSDGGGAVAVDVNYNPSGDAGAAIAARAQAFSELVGLGGLSISESSALEQARMANQTARQISSEETALGRYAIDAESGLARYEAGLGAALGRYGLDTERAIEEMRIRGAREFAEFQAQQVNRVAGDYRKNDVQRQATVLNALTSIWGVAPTYPERSSGGATGILGAIGGIVRGLGGLFNPVGAGG